MVSFTTSSRTAIQDFAAKHRRAADPRRGKILVLFVITLPTLCGMIGLVVDSGLLLSASRQAQHIADSAATAAAKEKQNGAPNDGARAVAEVFVHQHNLLPNATVTLHSPPQDGAYTGSANYVEVLVETQVPTYFIHLLGGPAIRRVLVRSVAGHEPSTTDSAIIVLDPNPPPFDVSPLPTLPLGSPLPAITGGLEVLGVGTTSVDGAVLVNTEWGGQDENGGQVGESSGQLGLSHAVSATPIASVSRLRCRDLRVVGGVDNPANYEPYIANDPPPLKAGMLPVPDPFQNLPVPTTTVDPSNVNNQDYGSRSVVGLPLFSPPVTLSPGVYDWIEVISGTVNFQPGAYIIRGTNPSTQLALNVVGGNVQANGVMFYITDSMDFAPDSGQPDANDAPTSTPASGSTNTAPCVAINIGLLGSSYSGLNDPSSPFHGMFIYQRRLDRRPILLLQENLISAGQLHGTIYSKWGHVVLSGRGSYDARFVVGTMRIVALLDLQIRPSTLLPPAEDVYLVE